MKVKLWCAVFLVASVAQAKGPRFYEKGTLVRMNSVTCGSNYKSAEGVGGMLGVDGSSHMKSTDMLCPQYVLRTERTEYLIQPKETKHPFLLPIGDDAEFVISKDVMRLRVPELDNHERQFIVVSMKPRADAAQTRTRAATRTADAAPER